MKKKRHRKALHYWILPHYRNDFSPYMLRAPYAIAIVALLVGVQLMSGLGNSIIARGGSVFSAAVLASALQQLGNDDRSVKGLAPLEYDEQLAKAATMKAEDMAKNQYFAHTDPQGREPWYWFEQAGYRFDYAGENLAIDFSESKDVETAWMNSVKHRENILKPEYTRVGFGIAQGMFEGHPATYVVQFFAAPKSVSVSPALAEVAPSIPAPSPVKSIKIVQSPPQIQRGTVLAAAAQKVDSAPQPLKLPARALMPVERNSNMMGEMAVLLTSPSLILRMVYGIVFAIFAFILLLLGMHAHRRLIKVEAYCAAVVVLVFAGGFLWWSFVPGSAVIALM